MFHYSGDHVDEATSQGIRNGITFIILAGTKMIDQNTQSGKLMSIPGFDNSLNPSSGTDGIRISIHEDTTTPNPSLEGIKYYEIFYCNLFNYSTLKTNNR